MSNTGSSDCNTVLRIFAGVVVFLILATILYNIYSKPAGPTCIVRFARKTCKYCVNSQAEWDAFKAQAAADPTLPFKIVDVDMLNSSRATRDWIEKYSISTVPTVLKVKNGKATEYDGPRISTAYMKFALEE